ncbi:5817_t:CDS:2, partial [Funneliformis geosporum]
IPGWHRKSEREGALSSPTVPVVHTDFCYSLVDESSRDGVERLYGIVATARDENFPENALDKASVGSYVAQWREKGFECS